MAPLLLEPFPALKAFVKRYEEVRLHSLIDWENRIDPALYDLNKKSGVKKTKVIFNGKKVAFCGTDSAMFDFLKTNGREHFFMEPQIFLYSYSGLDDLSILRRLKEFPDETPSEEIKDYWLAESDETGSILIINPEKA